MFIPDTVNMGVLEGAQDEEHIDSIINSFLAPLFEYYLERQPEMCSQICPVVEQTRKLPLLRKSLSLRSRATLEMVLKGSIYKFDIDVIPDSVSNEILVLILQNMCEDPTFDKTKLFKSGLPESLIEDALVFGKGPEYRNRLFNAMFNSDSDFVPEFGDLNSEIYSRMMAKWTASPEFSFVSVTITSSCDKFLRRVKNVDPVFLSKLAYHVSNVSNLEATPLILPKNSSPNYVFKYFTTLIHHCKDKFDWTACTTMDKYNFFAKILASNCDGALIFLQKRILSQAIFGFSQAEFRVIVAAQILSNNVVFPDDVMGFVSPEGARKGASGEWSTNAMDLFRTVVRLNFAKYGADLPVVPHMVEVILNNLKAGKRPTIVDYRYLATALKQFIDLKLKEGKGISESEIESAHNLLGVQACDLTNYFNYFVDLF